jgi:S1-C subfamily serine protease
MKKQIGLALIALVLTTAGCGLTNTSALPETLTSDVTSPGESGRNISALLTPLPPATLEPEPTALSAAVIAQADAEELLLINLYERVSPSVVNLDVVVIQDGHPPIPEDEIPEDFFQFPDGPFRGQGQGSGFVYDQEGHIITNNHVVADATEIFVVFHDGTSVPAEVVATDADSDLAVLKVDVDAASLRPVSWGDSEALKIGQRAVAIGNPFGLPGTLTSGIVSGVGRSLPSVRGGYRIPEIIQTDAAINPGNSGGPLFDTAGNVIGVTSAIVPRFVGSGERSFLGVGFAIPGNMARRVIPALIENGAYEHPWIGFQGNSLTPEIANVMRLPQSSGALVIEVIADGPGDKAGLRGGNRPATLEDGRTLIVGGDVIIGIDDDVVRQFDDLLSYLSRKGDVGQTVTLTIIRDNEIQNLEVTLGARPLRGLSGRP